MATLKTTTFDSALVIADTGGRILAINDRCSEMFGWSSEELTGHHLHELMPSPYKEQHRAYIQRYVSGGVAKMIGHARNVQGLRKDGSVFPLMLAVKLVKYHDRILFHGFMKHLEESVAIIRFRKSTMTIISSNQLISKVFGFDVNDVVGQSLSLLFTQEVDLENVVSDPMLNLSRNLLARDKHDSTFPVSAVVERTEYKDVFELRAERVHWKLEAVATVDSVGKVLSANDNFLPLFGYKKEELLEQNVNILMPSPYKEHHHEYMARYVQTQDARILGKGKRMVHAKHKDGSVFPVWLDVNKWEGNDGQPLFSGILTRVKKDGESVVGPNTGVQTKLEYLGDYLLCDTLGKGSSASVKLGRHSKTGKAVALKLIRKTEHLNDSRIQQEISIMRGLSHPHIASIFDVIDGPDFCCVVVEFMSNGDLCALLEKNRGFLSENAARVIFRQLISAIHYLHSNGIVHRDIKLENVLLDESNNVRLIDFGLATRWEPGQLLHTMCGTPSYSAPQLLLAQPYAGPPADVWSLGVLLYCLTCASFPFVHPQASVDGVYKDPIHLSAGLRDLLSRMLIVHPDRRASIKACARHPWTNEGFTTSPIESSASQSAALGKRSLESDDSESRKLRAMSDGLSTSDESVWSDTTSMGTPGLGGGPMDAKTIEDYYHSLGTAPPLGNSSTQGSGGCIFASPTMRQSKSASVTREPSRFEYGLAKRDFSMPNVSSRASSTPSSATPVTVTPAEEIVATTTTTTPCSLPAGHPSPPSGSSSGCPFLSSNA